MKKVYIATIAVAVAAGIVGGILLMESNEVFANNSAAASSPNHQTSTGGNGITQKSKAANGANNNFGLPDDGGFSGPDQLLG